MLKLTPYLECLGPGGGSQDPNNFPVPKSISVKDVNQPKLLFLQKCPVFQQEFSNLLSQHYALAKFADDTITVDCTLTPAVHRARQIARTWSADVQCVITKCLGTVEVSEVPIPQYMWSEAEEAVGGVSRDLGIVIPKPDDNVLTVIGKGIAAEELLEDVKTRVKRVEEEIEQKKQEVTETHELKPHQLRLLAAKSFDRSHPDVSVEMLLDMQVPLIVLKGNKTSVKDTFLQMYKLLQKVQSEKLTNVSSSVKILLKSEETELFIMQKIKGEELVALWETDEEDVIVYAFSTSDAQWATETISASIVEDVVELSKGSSDLLQSSEWQELEKCLMDKHAGVLVIRPEAESQKVNITGTDNILPGVKQDITDFMQKHTILTRVVYYQPNRQKFIVTVWSSKLQDICEKLKKEKVQITPRNADMELKLKGTVRGLELATEKLESLGRQVVMHRERYTMLAMLKYFRHSDCPQGLKLIGSSNKCVLALQSEPHGLQVKVCKCAVNVCKCTCVCVCVCLRVYVRERERERERERQREREKERERERERGRENV